jgi:hypothetical protein
MEHKSLIRLAQIPDGFDISPKRISDHDKPSAVTLSETITSERDIVSDSSTTDVKEAYSIDYPTKQEGVRPSTSIEENGNGDHEPPPDGGLVAWLQVLAGWILVMNSR